MTWTPWQFMMTALAGWMNRQQQEVIEFLWTENQIPEAYQFHQRDHLAALPDAPAFRSKSRIPTIEQGP